MRLPMPALFGPREGCLSLPFEGTFAEKKFGTKGAPRQHAIQALRDRWSREPPQSECGLDASPMLWECLPGPAEPAHKIIELVASWKNSG